MKKFFILLMVAITSGCTGTQIQQYSLIDTDEKTINVDAGMRGLKGELKQILMANNWKMFVDNAGTRTTGTAGHQIDLMHQTAHLARYRLAGSWVQVDLCFNFSPLLNYEIAVIDNITGSEVFSLYGKDCQSTIGIKFERALKNESIHRRY